MGVVLAPNVTVGADHSLMSGQRVAGVCLSVTVCQASCFQIPCSHRRLQTQSFAAFTTLTCAITAGLRSGDEPSPALGRGGSGTLWTPSAEEVHDVGEVVDGTDDEAPDVLLLTDTSSHSSCGEEPDDVPAATMDFPSGAAAMLSSPHSPNNQSSFETEVLFPQNTCCLLPWCPWFMCPISPLGACLSFLQFLPRRYCTQ